MLICTATAHPFGERFAAVWTQVAVTDHEVTVTLTADVPHALVRALGRAEEDPSRLLEIFPHDLHLTVDREPVELAVLHAEHSPDLISGHAEVYTLHLRAPLTAPSSPQAIRLRHGVLGGAPTWLRADLTVSPTYAVEGTSLDATRQDHRALLGRWTRSRRPRDLSVDLAPSHDPLAHWIAPRLPLVPADHARPVHPVSAWRDGRQDTSFTLGVASFVGLILSAATAQALRWRMRIAGSFLGMAVAAWIPLSPWLSALGIAALASVRRPGAGLLGLALASAWTIQNVGQTFFEGWVFAILLGLAAASYWPARVGGQVLLVVGCVLVGLRTMP